VWHRNDVVVEVHIEFAVGVDLRKSELFRRRFGISSLRVLPGLLESVAQPVI
jgi:hypothetical protein